MTVVRIIHAPDRRALACQAAAALAGEGYGVLRAEPAEAGALAGAAAADVVLWSPELLQWPEALEVARRAFEARRLVPAALGAFDPPEPFAALQPVDLAGWRGAADDPRWRFVLDDIALARRRAALASEPAEAETPAPPPREESRRAPARDDAGEAAFAFAEDPLAGAPAVEEAPFILPIRTIMVGVGVLALAALVALFAAPRPQAEKTRAAPQFAPAPVPDPAVPVETAPVLAFARPAEEAGAPLERPPPDVAPPPLRDAPLSVAADDGGTDDGADILPTTDEMASPDASAEKEDLPPETPSPAEAAEEEGERGEEGGASEEVAEILTPRLPPTPADDFLGVVFRDCLDCPDMAEIPGGAFRMGAPDNEPGRDESEGPARLVALAPFALSRREITRAQWAACVRDGACPPLEAEPPAWADGRARARLPAAGVSWEDARRYADWLSAKTGRAYRLPSEAEWEYAARAGRASPYAFGAAPGPGTANFDGALRALEDPEAVVRAPLPAGSYPANAFGLFDMHGNVWEWVADCWTDSHAGAPEDGRARSWDCAARALKGGSYASAPADLRAARRRGLDATARRPDAGFRVARDLP
ncbi:formylglycine-generating enzyme family protein [Amphiplicatus metriothermophilus]|uniref:Formylglycine-generating enzyme, required for sulfatase activity, contains SUMF1/FGE domain n=1 Tax=Amphiplicatus metriothermophilus TaxID=1519374 RepID=A0A239PK62_9PROT|nr:formylglycine-generating enzyme family protein [Amphiplicatus metriothermophilus]MBB5517639.1 formylglycine-generating enzyme required for sulfatase activity [Amphiplicatus metriothermophilus]SNT68027.1 Formylglycine-generating enzyme, required for sulfatase activity, contains SUMF1/FGE domain [Amphiplicatus metriothermophilus]